MLLSELDQEIEYFIMRGREWRHLTPALSLRALIKGRYGRHNVRLDIPEQLDFRQPDTYLSGFVNLLINTL